MRVYSPRNAVLNLLRVARKLANSWPEDGLLPDLEALHLAYRGLTVAIAQQRPAEPLEGLLEPDGPARFEAALWIIDSGVYEPMLVAQAMVRACAEIAQEQGDPALDPATRLIAYQLARAANAPPRLRDADGLLFECTRRTFGR